MKHITDKFISLFLLLSRTNLTHANARVRKNVDFNARVR